MTLQEYSKYSASPPISSIAELVRIIGPDILLVYRLILHNVGLKTIGKQDLNGFSNLRHLNLSGNSIIKIQGLNHLGSTLQFLDLSCNRITKIPPNAFKQLYNLRKLSLAYNHISSLETLTQMHGSQYKLEHLDLRNNEIKSLKHVQYLKGLVNLKFLIFQNADRTAQNPLCANFHHLMGQLRQRSGPSATVSRNRHLNNWRAFVRHHLPLLQYLDQVRLYSEEERPFGSSTNPQSTSDSSDAVPKTLESAYERDLMNEYPELKDLLDDDQENEEDSLNADDDLDRFMKEDEEYERKRREGRVDLNNPSSNAPPDETQPEEMDLPAPSVSSSPIVPAQPQQSSPHLPPQPPSSNQGRVQKSQVFNHQFKKLGSFINRRKKPEDGASGRNQDKAQRMHRQSDDQSHATPSSVSNSPSHDEDDSPSPPRRKSRHRKSRKRKSIHSSLSSDLSDIRSSASLPEVPHFDSDNLRSLPSVLSFASSPAPSAAAPEQPAQESFTNEEREKLIAKIAELSETLGTNNAYIQHREIELAQEAKRRRHLEEKLELARKKATAHKDKNKAFVKVVNQLKEHIFSLKNYQQQLETTIRQSNEGEEQLKQENQKLTSQIDALQERVDQCTAKLSSQKTNQTQQAEIQQRLQEREEELKETQQTQKDLSSQIDQYRKEILALKYKLKKQEEKHKRSLKKQSKLLDQQILMRQDDQNVVMERLKAQHEQQLSTQQEHHEQEMQNLREHLESQSRALREELSRQKEDSLGQYKSQHEKEMEALRHELEKQNKALQEQLSQIQEQELQPKEDRIRDFEKKNIELQEDLKEAQSANERHLSQIRELKDYLKKYINQEIHARATEDSLKEIVENQKQKLKDLASRMKNSQGESKKREQSLHTQMETWQHKYETDISSLQSKLKMLSINSNTKDKVIEKLEKKIGSFEHDSDQIESQYKSQLEEQQQQLDESKRQLKRLETENNIQKHLIDDKEDTVQSLRKEVEELRKENKKLETELDYLDDKVERLRDAEALSHEESTKKSQQIEELQLEQEEMSRILSKENQKRQKQNHQIEELKRSIEEQHQKQENLKQEKEKLRERCRQMEDRNADLEDQLEQTQSRLQRLMETEIPQYKQELVNQQAQLKYLVGKVEKDAAEKENLKRKLKKVRKAFEEDVFGDDEE